jgi:hypothetical protein
MRATSGTLLYARAGTITISIPSDVFRASCVHEERKLMCSLHAPGARARAACPAASTNLDEIIERRSEWPIRVYFFQPHSLAAGSSNSARPVM